MRSLRSTLSELSLAAASAIYTAVGGVIGLILMAMQVVTSPIALVILAAAGLYSALLQGYLKLERLQGRQASTRQRRDEAAEKWQFLVKKAALLREVENDEEWLDDASGDLEETRTELASTLGDSYAEAFIAPVAHDDVPKVRPRWYESDEFYTFQKDLDRLDAWRDVVGRRIRLERWADDFHKTMLALEFELSDPKRLS